MFRPRFPLSGWFHGVFRAVVPRFAKVSDMRNDKVQVVFAVNDLYCLPLLVTLQSLRESNPDIAEHAHVTVLHQNLRPESAERIGVRCDRLGLSVELRAAPLPDLPYNLCFGATLTHYLRFAIPELLAGHDRVLYLDADLVIKDDLRPLLTANLHGLPFGAVRDPNNPLYRYGRAAPGWRALGIPDDREYFNSGVMLLDFSAGAGEVFDRALRVIEDHSEMLRLHDQDALNIAAADRWCRLPRRWNAFPFSALLRTEWIQYGAEDLVPMADLLAEEPDAAILHYVTPSKPWLGLLPDGPANDLYQAHLTTVLNAESELSIG
ncbi:glycosyltransferase family 8 protein [Actinokineospora fastidiosa]|uniref:glycosyltransferase family 8 protein n=1 Tax=Actinokineospora fastidiosa TaxID=1816 RepID=UPI00166F7047|nr:glycosyltransferase family 8 protein [Actinokineospora fastidiosa]